MQTKSKYIPTKKQWTDWSLPSKASYLGVPISILGIIIAIVFFCIDKSPNPNIKKTEIPPPNLFEDGYNTYHTFQLSKSDPMPFEVGTCPGEKCYRFTLGPRERKDNVEMQTIYLDGGGFQKLIERNEYGRVEIFRLAKLQIGCGSAGNIGIIFPLLNDPLTVKLGLYQGSCMRLRAIDDDVVLIVEDDSINHLVIGVAIYDGTFCENYRKSMHRGKIQECAE